MNPDRIFFNRVLPWSDGTPWFNLHFTDDKKRWLSRAYKTVDAMVKDLAWIKCQPYVRDIYCCMSSQTVSTQKVSANGYTWWKGERSKEGALELKSLFLDIDVKKGAYATTEEAIDALQAFMTATGLPRPTIIVATGGGGLHVHWVLDRALKVAEWLPLANALKQACKQHGFKTDDNVTADAARILRVPDTTNWKYPSKPIARLAGSVVPNDYPVDYIAGKLAVYMLASAAGVNRPTPAPGANVHQFPSGLNSDLTGGMASDSSFIFDEYENAARFLLGKGEFARTKYDNLRDFLFATAWAATAYPMLTDKLEQLFKDISTAVPDRDPSLADKRWAVEMARIPGRLAANAKLIKPATVYKMALDLGWSKPQPAPPPPGTTTDLPPGYTRQPDGTIWGRRDDPTSGVSIPFEVSSYPMDQAWLSDEPALNFITVIGKRQRTMHIPTEKAASKQTMATTLGAQGLMMPTTPKKSDEFYRFIVAWITQLQTDQKVSHAPAFGWAPGGGFAFNGKVHTAGAPTNAGRADNVIGRTYEPRGDLQTWLDAAALIIAEDRPDINAIIASAFAAPLVKFTGQEGLLVSAYSHLSGVTKTVALRIAAAVWGHPINSTQTLSDTQNAVVHKLGEVRHLPVYWDEVKGEEQAQKFVSIAFQLGQGRDKSRMTQTIVARESGSWETMLTVCSNDSIAEAISTVQTSSTAGVHRLFEFRVKPSSQTTSLVTVASMINALKDNYGHAGEMYASHLGRNQDAIKALVKDTYDKMMTKFAAPTEERYWIATIAVLRVGARLANDLGLTSINELRLFQFLETQLGLMRVSSATSSSDLRNASNLSSVLAEFLRDMRAHHTVYTDVIWAQSRRPRNGEVVVLRSPDDLKGIKVQIGKGDKKLRVAAVDLTEWFKSKKTPTQAFYNGFVEQFKMEAVTKHIAAGTEFATGQMKCKDFDLSDPAMAGFFDGIDLA